MRKQIAFAVSMLTVALLFTLPVSAQRLDGHEGEYTGPTLYSFDGHNYHISPYDWFDQFSNNDSTVTCRYPITQYNKNIQAAYNTGTFSNNGCFISGTGSFSVGWSNNVWYNNLSHCNLSYQGRTGDSRLFVRISRGPISINAQTRMLNFDNTPVYRAVNPKYSYYDSNPYYANYDWWSATNTLQNPNGRANNGQNYVAYAGMDNCGNFTTGQGTLWYDNTPPTVSFGSSGSEWTKGSASMSITASDATSGLKSVSYTIENTDSKGKKSSQIINLPIGSAGGSPATGPKRVQKNLVFSDDGIYNVTSISATDCAGNTTSSKGGKVEVDNTPPTGDGLFTFDPNSDTLSASVNNVSDGEGSGVASVYVELTDADDPSDTVDVPLSGGEGTYTLSSTELLEVNGACFRESNKVCATIYAEDKVGNKGTIGSQTFDLLYITASVWPTAEPNQNIAKQGQQITFTVHTVGDPVQLSYEYPPEIYGVRDSGLWVSTETQGIQEQDIATNQHTYTLSLYVPMTLAPQYKDYSINRLKDPYNIIVTATKMRGYTKSVTLDLDVQYNIYHQFRTKFIN